VQQKDDHKLSPCYLNIVDENAPKYGAAEKWIERTCSNDEEEHESIVGLETLAV